MSVLCGRTGRATLRTSLVYFVVDASSELPTSLAADGYSPRSREARSLLWCCPMSKSWFVAALLVATGCGGRDGAVAVPAMDASAPDGAGAAGALFQDLFPQQQEVAGQPGAALAYQCLERPLPVAGNGLPNCIVVSPQMPAGGTAQDLAACKRCDAPGFEPFVASIPLERIGEGLSSYACICAVSPLARDLPCPGMDPSTASWCYADGASGSPQEATCSPHPGSILGFSGQATARGPLYVACFEPSAT